MNKPSMTKTFKKLLGTTSYFNAAEGSYNSEASERELHKQKIFALTAMFALVFALAGPAIAFACEEDDCFGGDVVKIKVENIENNCS